MDEACLRPARATIAAPRTQGSHVPPFVLQAVAIYLGELGPTRSWHATAKLRSISHPHRLPR
jgi:hypothetical protein